MSSAAGGQRQVVLDVPELDGPSFGWGCRAVTRVDVLLEEIDSWPGLLALDVDPEQATAVVLVSPGHDDDLSAALEALADRGLAAVVLPDPPPPASPD
ncbi:MAG: hypothetical protein M3P83_07165 [Actinomycetota bacterium]|nr:hypothetical protein [Actinomycetota bacterium]